MHGLGSEAGAALVEHPGVDLVSFTGSAATGRSVNERAAARLAKVCLELGGKNALVVCDDADLDLAVHWAAASAFSNAGQRCAAASRIVVFDAVYDAFRERLVAAAAAYPAQPVISEESLERILLAVRDASAAGASVLCGGERLDGPGWHLAPTVVEGVAPDAMPLVHGALRARGGALPRARPRRGARGRQRLAVRPHGGDPHGEPAPRDALRRAGAALASWSSTAARTGASRTWASAA